MTGIFNKTAILTLALLLVVVSANDNYYLFARQWPPTSCLTTACNYKEHWNGANLNIHGLWLNNGPAGKCGHPSTCLNTPFDVNALSSQTKSDLTYHWVGVFNDSNAFHNHEWTKHGTCYEKQLVNPSKPKSYLRILQEANSDAYIDRYFRQAITLNQRHAAISLLKGRNIVPSKTVGYSLANMLAALGTSTSNSFLACKNINGKFYWNSYYICYNKSWQIINCPCALGPISGEVTCPAGTPIWIPTP